MENILSIPFLKHLSSDIAVDLGTSNSRISSDSTSAKFSESSFAAYDQRKKQVIAVGDMAKKMLGRTPPYIKIIRPIKNGIIGNKETACYLIAYLMKNLKFSNLIKPRVLAGVPDDSSEIERFSVLEAFRLSGARIVYLIEQIIAVAIGSDIPVMEANGNIIVDLGTTSCRVAIISLGGIVKMQTTPFAGEYMDKAVSEMLMRKYNLLVGELTCEKIKLQLGSAVPLDQKNSMHVGGRNIKTGLPDSATVWTNDVFEALSEPVNKIVKTIESCIESAPHGFINDIVDKGITISGGIASMRGLDRLITKKLRMKCKIAPEPSFSLVRGMERILADKHLMRFFFNSSQDRLNSLK
ncbi:rod shape-determining protein [bacterium]|nr:rod shape-determining protein [bacterium]